MQETRSLEKEFPKSETSKTGRPKPSDCLSHENRKGIQPFVQQKSSAKRKSNLLKTKSKRGSHEKQVSNQRDKSKSR